MFVIIIINDVCQVCYISTKPLRNISCAKIFSRHTLSPFMHIQCQTQIVLECALNTLVKGGGIKQSPHLYVIYPWCSTFYLVIVIRLLLSNLYDHATISPIIVVSIIIIVSELAINNDYLITLCVHHTYIQHCKTHTHCGYFSVSA